MPCATYKLSHVITDLAQEFYAVVSHVTQDRKLPAERPECPYNLKFIVIIRVCQNSPNHFTDVRKPLDYIFFSDYDLV